MLYGKDFVNTHSKAFAHVLEKEITKLLNPQEILLSLSFSISKHSYYVTLLNTELHKWVNFRISDHKRKGSLKSLYSIYYDHYSDVESMMDDIKEYLDKTSWSYFSYQHYFILKAIKSMPHYKGGIYVKIPKGDPKHLNHKVTFEQEVNEGKILIETKDIDNLTENLIRSLYVQNMLASEMHKHTRKSQVYVRSIGMKLLERFDTLYYKQYEDDFSEDIYQNFKVPDKEEICIESDEQILLQMEDLKAFNRYYVYGLINKQQHSLIHIGYHLGNLTVGDLEEIPVIKKYKHHESIMKDPSLVSPVVFMTDITEREAQITVKAMLNQYRIFNPANFGEVVSYNQMYNDENEFQIDDERINHKIYGDYNMLQHHIQTEYVDIEQLNKAHILIVKISIDSDKQSVSASRTYSTTSKVIKKALVSHLEISERVANKVEYIVGIHPHDGRVITVYKVKEQKKRYTKYKNTLGKSKYIFNFYAYTEKASTINDIKLVKTNNTVLTNYQFVDQYGMMKRSQRKVVFVKEK